VVLFASQADYTGAERSVEYTTTKFSVRNLLRGLRKQAADLGIRLNAISPFSAETPLTAHVSPMLKELNIPLVPVDLVTEGVIRAAKDQNAWGNHENHLNWLITLTKSRPHNLRHTGRLVRRRR